MSDVTLASYAVAVKGMSLYLIYIYIFIYCHEGVISIVTVRVL